MFKKLKPYIISVAIALGVGGISALITSAGNDFYETIEKPFLSPPSWLFPVVWTILFTIMGITAAMVYTDKSASKGEKYNALAVYAIQLVFNFLWSIIFFNLRMFLFAFIWLVGLWILIFEMIRRFYGINKLSGILNIPYLIWVTFAGYLNFMIFLLN